MSGDPQALAKVERAPQPLLEKLGLTAEQFTALDVDKMQRILDFSLQVESEQARRAWEEAFERAQRRVVAIDIPKLTEGDRGSKYAKTEQICRVLDPILVDEGFSWSFDDEDDPQDGYYKVVMLLSNSGHTERRRYRTPAWDGRGPKGSGVMTPVQASGATGTYAERRLRMRVFGLHLVDDDHDGSAAGAPATITADQAADLAAAIQESKAPLAGVLASQGVERLEDLTAAGRKGVIYTLEQRKRLRGTR